MPGVTEAIDRLMATAEKDYRTALGGEAACTVHRDGRVTGGITYHEGRLIALREAQNLIEGSTPDTLPSELVALRDRWRNELETRRTGRINTPPWVAYATGGVDAATDLLAAIETD